MITTLVIKLDQLLGIQNQAENAGELEEQIKRYNNRLRNIKKLAIALNLGVYLILAGGIIWMEFSVRHRFGISDSRCEDRERFEDEIVV